MWYYHILSSENVSIEDKTEEAKGPRVFIDKQKSKKQKQAKVHGTENLFENMTKASVSSAYKAIDSNVSAAQMVVTKIMRSILRYKGKNLVRLTSPLNPNRVFHRVWSQH